MTRRLRTVCAVAGFLLLSLLFVGGYDSETTGHTTRTRWRLGVWFSPWFVETETTTLNEPSAVPGGSGYSNRSTTTTRVQFFSASWVVLAGGVALIVIARRKPPTPDPALPQGRS